MAMAMAMAMLASVVTTPAEARVGQSAVSKRIRPAEVVYRVDPRGDVRSIYDGDHSTVDATKLILNRSNRRALVIKTRLVNMVGNVQRYNNSHVYDFITPNDKFLISTFKPRENKCRRQGQGDRTCRSITWAINPRTRTHVLTVPWRVLGNPRWIRIASNVLESSGDTSDAVGRRGGGLSFTYGPRFYRSRPTRVR